MTDLLTLPEVSRLEELFELAPEIPNGLRRKVSRGGQIAGSPAGCFQKRYFRVRIDGELYLNHRIIYQLKNPTEDLSNIGIDHKDGETQHNHPDNLRKANAATQARNRKMRSDNSSGETGIRFCIRSNRWIAFWHEEGKQRKRYFPISTYGEDGAYQAALKERTEQFSKLTGYSERHGKQT